jgi:hypothetical protein
LRREEVAELACIGVDWYLRLEQGRTVSQSDTTLQALARALRLGKVEAAHLRALTRSGDRQPFTRESVPGSIASLIATLGLPAYVTGMRWDLLTWNATASDLLGFDRLAEAVCNVLVFMFIEPDSRRLFGATWTSEARRTIALFRATHDLSADDPAFVKVVERLRAHSTEFAQWWNAHDVPGGASGQKVLTHPERGAQRYDYTTFQANDDPALKLAIYTPA